MKIQIHDNEENSIEGFTSIKYQNFDTINEVINNSCEYILANNVFDNFSYKELDSILNILIQKLRINGTLSVSGTDIKIMSKFVCNNSIDPSDVSNIISSKKSIHTTLDIITALENKNLNIISTKIAGLNYEILCSRK